jgi:hypothetical protein
MTGEDMEAKNGPEAQAAKGMEVRKTVGDRLVTWKKNMMEKNKVSQEYTNAWKNLTTSLTTEGSARRAAMDTLTPVVGNLAVSRGLTAEAKQWALKTAGLVCGAASFLKLGGPEIAAPLTAVATATGLAARIGDAPERFAVKFMGKSGEMMKKSGATRSFDAIVDKIVGWKGPDMKQPMPKMA